MKTKPFRCVPAALAAAALLAAAVGSAAEPEETGWIYINTKPHAEVLVDGTKIGPTPVLKHALPAGKHEVLLVSDAAGVKTRIHVVIESGQSVKIVKNLNKIKKPPPPDKNGTLSVNSVPPTTVYIDGCKIGLTPLSRLPLAPGKHKMEMINLEREIHFKTNVVIQPGKHKKIVKKFEEKKSGGTLSVSTTPWTEVIVDGNKIGNSPIKGYRLDPGSYKVELINDEFDIHYSTTVTIVEGKTSKIAKSFKKAATEMGTLSIITKPPTQIYIDGKKVGNSPLHKHELKEGLHEVKLVSWKSWIHHSFTVEIKKGKHHKIVKNLEPDEE